MSWGGYLTGDMVRDEAFMEKLLDARDAAIEPYLPGMELVDEDEGEATEVSLLSPPTAVYRVVDAQGSKTDSFESQHYYVTAGTARGQATRLNKQHWLTRGPFRAQRVLVTESDWEDI